MARPGSKGCRQPSETRTQEDSLLIPGVDDVGCSTSQCGDRLISKSSEVKTPAQMPWTLGLGWWLVLQPYQLFGGVRGWGLILVRKARNNIVASTQPIMQQLWTFGISMQLYPWLLDSNNVSISSNYRKAKRKLQPFKNGDWIWIQWYSTCLECARAWALSPVLQKYKDDRW